VHVWSKFVTVLASTHATQPPLPLRPYPRAQTDDVVAVADGVAVAVDEAVPVDDAVAVSVARVRVDELVAVELELGVRVDVAVADDVELIVAAAVWVAVSVPRVIVLVAVLDAAVHDERGEERASAQ